MQLQRFFYLLFLGFCLTACSSGDDAPQTPEGGLSFEDGIFILNEGNFGQGNASVSFLAPDSSTLLHNIFSTVNQFELGDTATDMAFFEEHAYIVLNASNAVEIVNRNTFEAVATIDTELNNPRKMAFLEGNLYITNWGEGGDATDDYVAVYNTENFELLEKIPVEEGPEDIISHNGSIFVAHAGGWSFNNKISVIRGTGVHQVIEVGQVPNSLAVENGNLWVASAGLPDYAGDTSGTISRINLGTLEVEQEYDFPGTGLHPANLSISDNRVFYTLRGEVYSFSPADDVLPAIADFPIEEVSYLYGLSINDGKLYAASASHDFTGNGKLLVYDLSGGDLLAEYQTGINPRGAFFN